MSIQTRDNLLFSQVDFLSLWENKKKRHTYLGKDVIIISHKSQAILVLLGFSGIGLFDKLKVIIFDNIQFMENNILSILRSKNTVFTFREIALLWRETNVAKLKLKVHRYVKAGKLHAIRRGIYAKDKNYDPYELAAKIYSPSYISFETVLRDEGVVFQYYGTIFAASYLSREIQCDGKHFAYRKLKDAILAHPLGLVKKGAYTIASRERALMDSLYLYKDYHFDNLRGIDWDLCFKLLPVYGGKTMEPDLKSHYDHAQKS